MVGNAGASRHLKSDELTLNPIPQNADTEPLGFRGPLSSYESFDRLGDTTDTGTGTSDYVVDFQQTLGAWLCKRAVTARHGSRPIVVEQ
jgi:hypothetical protein